MNQLKKIAERIPAPVSKILATVPFRWRLGSAYSSSTLAARELKAAPPKKIREWIFPRLQRIVEYSYHHNIFYKTICERHGFHPEHFKTLEHFQDAPIITKNDLRDFDLSHRSMPTSGRMLINTGGTSGEPLAFYIDKHAFAREWAHMHFIWSRAGYSYRDVKLTMRGRNLGERLIQYNPVHNEWVVNTYTDRKRLFSVLSALVDRENIRWIHGYPSIVAEIVSEMAQLDDALVKKLSHTVKGVLLGSEFPASQYVMPIRQILGRDPTAWYGHSEMCVLAYENGTNNYIPLHSYGFVEAVGDNGTQRLLGTSYYNTASPFIRYDTGDMIAADAEQGVVQSFQITSGRIGDFVIDRDGVRIALTALIFGRHHSAFNSVRHVQVRQHRPGNMELLIVPKNGLLTSDDIMPGFDFSNVKMNVFSTMLTEPIRTAAGKINLLVK